MPISWRQYDDIAYTELVSCRGCVDSLIGDLKYGGSDLPVWNSPLPRTVAEPGIHPINEDPDLNSVPGDPGDVPVKQNSSSRISGIGEDSFSGFSPVSSLDSRGLGVRVSYSVVEKYHKLIYPG